MGGKHKCIQGFGGETWAKRPLGTPAAYIKYEFH